MEAFKKATENVSVILRMYEEVENSDVINLKSEETNQ
jgi:hypothetical protein